MKKLIAIAVVFILAVGVAFAADVSVDVIGKLNLLKGDSADSSTVDTDGPFRRVRISAEGQNDDGNFGGWLRYDTKWDGNGGTSAGTVQGWGMAWWKPLDILKIQIGSNPDGHWGMDGVTRWAFYQVAGDTDVITENWRWGDSFTEGFGAPGLYVSLTPIEAMEINVAVPITDGWGGVAKDVYKKFYGQVSYNISSIGKVGVTYKSNKNELLNDDGALDPTPGKLFGYFGLTAIENLGIDLGIGYTLPLKDNVKLPGSTREVEVSVNAPVAVGLGVNFTTGALGIKARIQGIFGGSTTIANNAVKNNTVFEADLLPSFEVTDTVKAYLSTGLQMTSSPIDGVDSVVAWHIEPYVSVKANAWAPNFYAGIRFAGDGTGDKITTWSVPIGIWLSF